MVDCPPGEEPLPFICCPSDCGDCIELLLADVVVAVADDLFFAFICDKEKKKERESKCDKC